MDPRVEKLAQVIVHYSLELRPGQLMRIRGNAVAAPLMIAAYREGLRTGAHPYIRPRLGNGGLAPEGVDEIFLREASEEQLRYVSPFRAMEVEQIDADFAIWADTNTRSLTGVDPTRPRIVREATRPMQQRYFERAASGALKWCGTQYPTQADAQEAEMSLEEWEAFVYGAGYLDRPDPVAEWRRIREEQDRVVAFLSRVREVRVVGEDTDLVVRVDGRTWKNAAGEYNFPDGEVFTGPVEDATRGHIRFTYPAIYGGREVTDVHLWFEGGRVVRSEAAKGGEYLEAMLNIDEGARRLGEFAIGTNYQITRFVRNILFDEKIGGTVHMALGMSYPETGGVNESGLHWDMIKDIRRGGELHADGEVVYRDGAFLPGVVG